MKQSIVKKVALGLLVLVFIVSAVGCGAPKEQAMDMGGIYENSSDGMNSGNSELADTELPDVNLEGNQGQNQISERKIIENVELTVETKAFDAFMKKIEEQIASLGGYVESSNVHGREMDSYDNRSANMVIRIPADSSKNFSQYISENSVVIHRAVNTEDVTLQYVDTESRLKALRAEKEAFEKLLKNADKVEDIISVRDKLTDVIYEIESCEATLRTYDNLVSYATVTLWVNEVERTTVVKSQNTWQKIGTNLKNNFVDVWNGIVAIFIFLVSAIPYIIPFAVIGLLVLLIIWRAKKKKRNVE